MHVIRKEEKMILAGVKSNRGLSFVEILIAITLLAIIVGPVMNSIIASAMVNKESRFVMSATDMAQDIMEGFSDKNFYAISSIYSGEDGSGGAALLEGKYALSQINNDKYNYISSKIKIEGSSFSNLGPVSKTSIQIDGTVFSTQNIANDTAVVGSMPASIYMINKFAAVAMNQIATDSTKQALIMYADNASAPNCLFFAYTNVKWEGRKYDVVGYLIPVAKTANDFYYPYTMKVAVYEITGDAHSGISKANPIVTLTGGIKNN